MSVNGIPGSRKHSSLFSSRYTEPYNDNDNDNSKNLNRVSSKCIIDFAQKML